MPIALNVNGTNYFYPLTNEVQWGVQATNWAAAVTSGMLQKQGGDFTLLDDINFGPDHGMFAGFYSSANPQTAQSGIFRMANNEAVAWRNAGNFADLYLTVNSLNQLQFNGSAIGAGTVSSVGVAANAGVVVTNSPVTGTGTIILNLSNLTPTTVIANGNVSGANLLTAGNLSFTGAAPKILANFTTFANRPIIQTTVSNGATSIEAAPSGTATTSEYHANNSSDIANTAVIALGANNSSLYVAAATRGTGVLLPLELRMPSGAKLTVNTTGDISVAQNLNVVGNISAANFSGTNTGTQTITATGDVTGVSTGAPATTLPLTLVNTTVVPGSYTSANITVDSKGRITAASSGAGGIWGQITGTISNQTDLNNIFTSLGTSTLSTGVTTYTDTIGLIALNDTTVRLKAVTQGVFYNLIATGMNNATKTFAQQDYPLANLTFPSDGIFIRFIGLNNAGTVVTSPVTFRNDPTVLQFGYMIVKQVAGVKTFLDGAAGPRNVFTWPYFAGNIESTKEFLTPVSNVSVLPNTNLTVRNSSGVIKGLNINWGTANVNERPILSANPTSFITINPSTALAAALPAPGTAVQVTQYWNGTTMTNLGGANASSVQRFIVTIAGTIYLQVGEAVYANFADAIDSISIAPFTTIVPADSFIELCRFASRSGSNNLASNSDAVFSNGLNNGTGGGGGTGAGTVTSVNISGLNGVTAAGGPVTSSGSISVGLGDIIPTSVATGPINLTGNLNFTGLGQRITGNMTTGTLNNRLLFQTNLANSNSFVGVLPSGTAAEARYFAFNTSDLTNTTYTSVGLNPTGFNAAPAAVVSTGFVGTGALLPLSIQVQGLNGLLVDTLGNSIMGGIGQLATNATSRFLYLNSMAGTPTGIPSNPSNFAAGGKTPITVDTTNDIVYFYSNGAWRNVVSGNTAVTPGSYTSANITINAEGRITAASNGSGGGGGGVTSVNVVSTTLNSSGGPITTNGDITVDLPTQLSAGTYINAGITVDGFGRVTAAASGNVGIPDAPINGNSYVRKDGAWADINSITISGGSY